MLLDPDRRRRILVLALPIIGGMLSQNVLNLIDTAMVGSLDNPDPALAAVGIGGFTNFMASAFITGLATGVQTIAARRHGEGRLHETAMPLNGGLLLAVVLAVPLSLVLYQLAPMLFPLVENDPEVVAQGVPYWRARIVAMVALGANFAFRGYWNGVNLSRLYMQTLIVMHVSNIFLNWVLIFGNLGMPAMGVEGAGVATSISVFLGTAIYFALAWKHARGAGFLRGLPSRVELRAMLKLSVPSGVQSFFFAAGMTVFFAIIGSIGTVELAAANVLINLLLVAILPGIGFGLVASSLVSQALGRGDVEDAAAWGIDVSKLAMVIVGTAALVGVIFPDLILGVFLHREETLALARPCLRLSALFIAFDTLGMVLMNALLGAGASTTVMGVSVAMQWLVALPLAYVIGPVLGLGLFGVWCVQTGYRAVQSGIFLSLWRRRGWTQIKL